MSVSNDPLMLRVKPPAPRNYYGQIRLTLISAFAKGVGKIPMTPASTGRGPADGHRHLTLASGRAEH